MRFLGATYLVILYEKKAHALEAIQVLMAVFRKLELTMNKVSNRFHNKVDWSIIKRLILYWRSLRDIACAPTRWKKSLHWQD